VPHGCRSGWPTEGRGDHGRFEIIWDVAIWRAQLVNLASRRAVPATYGARDFVLAGGLTSYGSDLSDAYRQVGLYAGRIINGGTRTDLPVVHATRYELVINAELPGCLASKSLRCCSPPLRRDGKKKRVFISCSEGRPLLGTPRNAGYAARATEP
jgi:hypothetical protein